MGEERTEMVFEKTQMFFMTGGLADEKLVVSIRKGLRITAGQMTIETFLHARPVGIVEVIQDYQTIRADQLRSGGQIGARMLGSYGNRRC
jgi:hypothetical protein